MSKKHQVFVVWGEHVDKDASPCLYSFNTQGELDAFLLGLDEATGWSEAATFDNKEEACAFIEEEGHD